MPPDTRTVWQSHLPLVWVTINQMRARGELQQGVTDDLVQEGALAIGEALPRWDPAKGRQTTYLSRKIRSAILDHVLTEANRGVGSRRQRSATGSLPEEDEPSYLLPPEQYGDPLDEFIRLADIRAVRFCVSLLDDADRTMVTVLYGLTPDESRLTDEDYAALAGVPLRTVQWRKARAVDQLKELMR